MYSDERASLLVKFQLVRMRVSGNIYIYLTNWSNKVSADAVGLSVVSFLFGNVFKLIYLD